MANVTRRVTGRGIREEEEAEVDDEEENQEENQNKKEKRRKQLYLSLRHILLSSR